MPPDEPSARGDPRWVTGHAASRPAALPWVDSRCPCAPRVHLGDREGSRYGWGVSRRSCLLPGPPASRSGSGPGGGRTSCAGPGSRQSRCPHPPHPPPVAGGSAGDGTGTMEHRAGSHRINGTSSRLRPGPTPGRPGPTPGRPGRPGCPGPPGHPGRPGRPGHPRNPGYRLGHLRFMIHKTRLSGRKPFATWRRPLRHGAGGVTAANEPTGAWRPLPGGRGSRPR